MSSSGSESFEFEQENQELETVDENTLVKFRKKTSKITNASKMLLKDTPMEAETIIMVIRQTKDLVKYIKQVGL